MFQQFATDPKTTEPRRDRHLGQFIDTVTQGNESDAADGMALGVQQAVNNSGLTGKVLVYGTAVVVKQVTGD